MVVLAHLSIAENLIRKLHLFFHLPYITESCMLPAGIVSSPQSVNVSGDDHAVFNCTAIATFINWNVNGTSLNAGTNGFEMQLTIDVNVSQDLRTAALRVVGSPDANNSSIECVALLEQSNKTFDAISSAPALLLVQGIIITLCEYITVIIMIMCQPSCSATKIACLLF